MRKSALTAFAVVGCAALVGAGAAVGSTTAVKPVGKIFGIPVARRPMPGAIIPLTKQAKLPASVMNYAVASGQTYYGSVGFEGYADPLTVTSVTATSPAGSHITQGGAVISLPRLTTPLEMGDAGIVGGGLEPPGCDGSFDNPTAPPGVLCIYPGHASTEADQTADTADILNINQTGEAAWDVNPYVLGAGRFGVRLEGTAAGPGRFKFFATWAYTAP